MDKTKALLVNLSYSNEKISELLNRHREGHIDTDTLISSAILCLMSASLEDGQEDDQLREDLMTW